VPRGS